MAKHQMESWSRAQRRATRVEKASIVPSVALWCMKLHPRAIQAGYESAVGLVRLVRIEACRTRSD